MRPWLNPESHRSCRPRCLPRIRDDLSTTHPQAVTAGDSSSGWWQPVLPHWPGPEGWSHLESRGPVGRWHGPCGTESVDRSRVRLAVRLALHRLAGMQAGIGKTGISAMKGWEARDPQSQNGRGGGQPGAREGRAARGRRLVCEQPGQQQGLGTGPPETPGKGHTLP